jgi:hypothetical protein
MNVCLELNTAASIDLNFNKIDQTSSFDMASFPNVYTHRKVADTASKPCEICYKPSSSVLVASENKVFVVSGV